MDFSKKGVKRMWAQILITFALVLFLIAGGVPYSPEPWPWRSRLNSFGLACIAGALLLLLVKGRA
jgi:hypothetical protein